MGLAITKWPELLAHEPWELKDGTVLTMLVAMSVLALLGLRYPQRMLPILLFEVGWKLTWLGVVALPLWVDGNLTGATRRTGGCGPVGDHRHRGHPLAPRAQPVRPRSRRSVALT